MANDKIDLANFDAKTDPAFAKCRAEEAKLIELHEKEFPLKQREAQLRAQIEAAKRVPRSAESSRLSPADVRAVRELLGGTPDTDRLDAQELEADLQNVLEALRIVRLAIEKQKTHVAEARQAARLDVRAQLVPTHKALAQRIIDRLKDLREALVSEVDFREWLNDNGIDWGAPLLPAAIPLSFDRCERISYWLSEFEKGEGRYKLR